MLEVYFFFCLKFEKLLCEGSITAYLDLLHDILFGSSHVEKTEDDLAVDELNVRVLMKKMIPGELKLSCWSKPCVTFEFLFQEYFLFGCISVWGLQRLGKKCISYFLMDECISCLIDKCYRYQCLELLRKVLGDSECDLAIDRLLKYLHSPVLNCQVCR